MDFSKSKILFLRLFFIFLYVWAVPPAQLPAEPPAAEDIFRYPLTPQTLTAFNAACANLSGRPIIKGNFSQEKYMKRLDRYFMSSGNFIISTEQGMVWETLKPFPSAMIMGKNFIIQSRPDGQKSVISASGNETFTQMADVINAVFSGQSQGLLENFEVYFLGSVSNWSMGLLPKDKIFASFIAKITMSGDSAIKSIKLFEQNGDVITYALTNINYPTGLNDHEKAFFTVP